MKRQRAIRLTHLLALAKQLHEDEGMSRGELLERDSQIARDLSTQQPAQRIGAWLEAVGAESPPLRGMLGLVVLGLTLLGVGLGIATACAVFYYDGSRPINVVWAIGVFMLAQIALLLLTLLAMLPRRAMQAVIGIGYLLETLVYLSPGRLGLGVARWLPQTHRETYHAITGRLGAQQRLYADIQKWVILYWAQWFALGFHIAAIATFLSLTFFTDLAFGWSTTLTDDTHVDRLHQWLTGLSTPWCWLPQAVPSVELINASQYAQGQPFTPTAHRAWWPFLLAGMLTYGLLPRCVTCLLARQCRNAALHRALLAMPGVNQLLNRLDSPAIATQATDTENPTTFPPTSAASNATPLHGQPAVLLWALEADAYAAHFNTWLGYTPTTLHHAGGPRTIEQDQHTLKQLATEGADNGVVVMVKLWEPPLRDLLDLLRELRTHLNDQQPIVLLPIRIDSEGRVVSDAPQCHEQWTQRIATLADPWLSVGQPVGGEAS